MMLNYQIFRDYRKLFDDNELPDVYNGLMYFRYSQESAEFFWLAEKIFKNVLLDQRHEGYRSGGGVGLR